MSNQTPSHAPTTRDTSAPTPTNDNSLAWSGIRLLGFVLVDDVHEEFHILALKLVTYPGASAADTVRRFEQHAIGHSEQEDGWMRSTNLPPWDYHLAEHAAVLKSISNVKQAVALGETGADVIRSLEMALFDWFLIHADYLDSALVAWMTKQTTGGKPVVLRRTLV